MRNITRVVAAAGISLAGFGVVGLGAATVAQARYHWCPGEQWSAWMGANWDPYLCHDDHYIDLEPRDPAHWHGQGAFDPAFPWN